MSRFVQLIHPQIRPLSILNDISPTADLIDLCFSSQMDADGLEYSRYIRSVAKGARMVRWVDGSRERISVPLFGYVWEEDGKIVGNVSLSPFQWQKKWYYLIANVAVHPDYRRKGIAKKLTQQAVEHIRYRKVENLWLQVKDYNYPAIQLYESLGFKKREKRNTWRSSDFLYAPEPELKNGLHVVPRARKDWVMQKQWLDETYPEAIRWYFGLHDADMAPGLLRSLENYLLYEQVMHHFSAYDKQNLIGILTHQPVNSKVHHLYLGTDQTADEDVALRSLLGFALRMYGQERALRINYPFGRGHSAFEDSYFYLQNTLIWMSFEEK